MLRLTILESPAEQRFVVEGKLMQPWVSELESAWESARDARRGRRCVVDLSDTTGIDWSGRRLLMAMCGEGVRFIAKGVYVRHLIKHLRRNGAKQQAPAFLKTKQKKRSEPGCREDVGWRPLARPPLRITAIGVGQTAGGKGDYSFEAFPTILQLACPNAGMFLIVRNLTRRAQNEHRDSATSGG